VNVHLIHGIHSQGQSPIEALIDFLGGFNVRYPDYGWILGIETKFFNPVIVGTLLPYIEVGDILIGHSNGCAIIYDLMAEATCPQVNAVFINAALEQSIQRRMASWIDVYFNSGDEITEAAKIGAELGLTDAVWGEMGHAGYNGTDTAITNINCGSTKDMPVVSGHSDFFTPSKLSYWGPFLANRIREHLGS
jgi:hypothetical protein